MHPGQYFYRPSILQRMRRQTKRGFICFVLYALWMYVWNSSQWRRLDQLFVCFGSPREGSLASKQTISNWIIEAISLAYQVCGMPSPLAIRVHSKALLLGVSLQKICDAACWATPHTFMRLYSLHLPSMVGKRVLILSCAWTVHTRTGIIWFSTVGSSFPKVSS